jgi:hypothetical protein
LGGISIVSVALLLVNAFVNGRKFHPPNLCVLIKLKTRTHDNNNNNKQQPIMPLNEPAQIDRYMATLSEFMTYKDGTFYAPDEEFTQVQLLEIVPNDLYRWLCVKALKHV